MINRLQCGMDQMLTFLQLCFYVLILQCIQVQPKPQVGDSAQFDPKNSFGRLVLLVGDKKRVHLTYKSKPCFATAIKTFWVVTTCGCASVIDGEFIPEDTFKDPDEHTRIIGLYEGYYYEYRYDLPNGEYLISKSPIILVVRHPKCLVIGKGLRYNMAIIKVLGDVIELTVLFGHRWDEIYQGNEAAYNQISDYAKYSSCYVWYADPISLKLKKCRLWNGAHDVTPIFKNEKHKWNFWDEGDLCLQETQCDGKYSIGLPVTCAVKYKSLKKEYYVHKGLGIVTGQCLTCSDIKMYFFVEIMQKDTHFRSIEEMWDNAFLIKTRSVRMNPKLVWYDVPESPKKSYLVFRGPKGKDLYIWPNGTEQWFQRPNLTENELIPTTPELCYNFNEQKSYSPSIAQHSIIIKLITKFIDKIKPILLSQYISNA